MDRVNEYRQIVQDFLGEFAQNDLMGRQAR